MLAEQAAVRGDVERLVGMWSALLDTYGGPLLFGEFSIADAYFAPVVMRLKTYGVPVPPNIAAYMQRVTELPGVAAWTVDALAERDFLDFEEPYPCNPAPALRMMPQSPTSSAARCATPCWACR